MQDIALLNNLDLYGNMFELFVNLNYAVTFSCLICFQLLSQNNKDMENIKMENIEELSSLEVDIEGMTCGSCVTNVTITLKEKPGVNDVNINLEDKKGQIKYDSNEIKESDIINAISDMGYVAKKSIDKPLTSSNDSKRDRRTIQLDVKGMTCQSCVRTIQNQLKNVDGIYDVDVSLEKELVTVIHNPDNISASEIEHIIDEMGFEAHVSDKNADNRDKEERTVTTVYHIDGMTCDSCVKSITAALSALPGIININVSLKEKKAVVKHVPSRINREEVRDSIDDIGFEATIMGQGTFSLYLPYIYSALQITKRYVTLPSHHVYASCDSNDVSRLSAGWLFISGQNGVLRCPLLFPSVAYVVNMFPSSLG